jgi:beta-N-acetylhexosaminidase
VKPLGEDKLGQLFFLRLKGSRWSGSLGRQLYDMSPGGVLLSEPLASSAAATSEFLLRVARSLPSLPFLAVRQEGGKCDPLSGFLPHLPSPSVGRGESLRAVMRLGELFGEALSLLGFNTNFAPLLDLRTSFTEKTLGARTFGSDPCQVTECGRAFLRGLERHGILACGKHFPGLGSVPVDDSGGLPVSSKPMAALWREDLFPFRELLTRLPLVLVSPAAYKAYDFDRPRPASLSTGVVTGLLRVKLGYGGLALAYELESARGAGEIGDAAILALSAGCDMIVVDEGAPFENARLALDAGLESGKLLPQRVEQAVERIQAAKKRLRPPSGKVSMPALNRLVRRYEKFAMEYRREGSKDA